MRTRGLGVAGILMLWLALAPAVGRAQYPSSLGDGTGLNSLPGQPYLARGQDAAGYAPPDPILPIPIGSNRPDSGFFVDASYVMYRQNVPLKNQAVAVRGFVDSDGSITGTPGTFVGSGALALQTNQVRGPGSWEPGTRLGIGYRFCDGTSVEFSWMYLANLKFTAVATLAPPNNLLDPGLANTFLFSPVFNFPPGFAGPTGIGTTPTINSDTGVGNPGATFGIWNAADIETEEFDLRFQMYELTIRKPIFETEFWRTYGLIGPQFVWFWQRYKWTTTDLNAAGDAGPEDVAIYTNIVSNRMYGVKIGCGSECYLGNGFSFSCDLMAAGMLDIVKERVAYVRGDRHIGPERKRSITDFTFVPEARGTLFINWFPYEGIEVKLGYDVMAFANTVASQHPIDMDFSAVAPGFNRVWRFVDGFNVGLALKF